MWPRHSLVFSMYLLGHQAALCILVGLVALATARSSSPLSTWDTCEKRDGDCPDDCAAAGFNGTIGFVARLNISPTHPAIEAVAARAEKYIVAQGDVQVCLLN